MAQHKPVKTHTFRNGKYHISEDAALKGFCDVPPWSEHSMCIESGNTLSALDTAIHEAMHADGIPDRYLHRKDGTSDTSRISRLMWRLGWRRT